MLVVRTCERSGKRHQMVEARCGRGSAATVTYIHTMDQLMKQTGDDAADDLLGVIRRSGAGAGVHRRIWRTAYAVRQRTREIGVRMLWSEASRRNANDSGTWDKN